MNTDPPFEFEINVTQDHIDRGQRQNCEECPIALAVKEQFPDKVWNISVEEELFIDWKDGPYGESFIFPEIASAFIVDFDNNQPVGPFSFKVVLNDGWDEDYDD